MNFDRPIVIDTGVLVSAAIRPQSVPALALERALLHYDVCASPATFEELKTVLLRPKFDRYVSAATRQAFVEGLSQHLRMAQVTQQVTDCTDPKDNKFLALAVAVSAEMIVASDPHLTQMHPWQGIPILPPAAFLVAAR
ncbi:MAG: putative toxin-antitoxin system toxin component, PIN family [Polaromonas sp.]|uniref:putative toxin-antitoxin system toxin component, PIN family n=1 Tax=Polaromonas sp. TaxID=1869339 RepID=UPI002732E242|nr:putative toxin-antitoxin system toxin component, PIN family [Polaromonas sp.]MDP2817175.1 putative toxin-antitoxin system toxin component, PIN family [Polaromonas sp.]